MIKEKFNSNLGINYFYELFRLRKTVYPKGYFFLMGGRRLKRPLEKPLFRKLVSSFWGYYFSDFYSNTEEQYFPLSGKMMKARGKGFYKTKDSHIITESINWIWFLRPAFNYITNLKIIKLKGPNKRLDKLEKAFKENYDVGLLPDSIAVLKEFNENNKLYAQW